MTTDTVANRLRRFVDTLDARPWVVLIAAVSAIAWIGYANRLPDGFIVATGDVMTPPQIEGNFERLVAADEMRTWGYYGVFRALAAAGFDATDQASAYLPVFLILSFASFLAFLRLTYRQLPLWASAIISLLYAVNPYTLSLFASARGFGPEATIVPALPLLFGMFIAFHRSGGGLVSGSWFVIALALASSAFVSQGNVVVTALLLAATAIVLVTTGAASIRWSLVGRGAALLVAAWLVTAYWLPTSISDIREGVPSSASDVGVDPGWQIQSESDPLSNVLRLLPHDAALQFHEYFPYERFISLRTLFLVLSLWPAVILVVSFFGKRKVDPGLFTGLGVLFVLFAALAVRVRFPFAEGNNFLFFAVPGFDAIRGSDAVMPIVAFLLLALSPAAWLADRTRIVAPLVGIVAILSCAPFFTGRILQDVGTAFVDDGREDSYLEAERSPIVRIPDEYRAMAETINAEEGEFRVAHLPAGRPSAIGWDEYPAWGFEGVSPIHRLIESPSVGPNEYAFGDWLPAKDFEIAREDPNWLIAFYGLTGTRFVVLHADAGRTALRSVSGQLEHLERTGAIVAVSRSSIATLYRIPDDRILPWMFVADRDIILNESPADILASYPDARAAATPVEYAKLGANGFSVASRAVSGKPLLVLNEPYGRRWQAIYRDASGEETILPGVRAFGFLSGWDVRDVGPDGTVIVKRGIVSSLPYPGWIAFATFVISGGIIITYSVAYGKLRI